MLCRVVRSLFLSLPFPRCRIGHLNNPNTHITLFFIKLSLHSKDFLCGLFYQLAKSLRTCLIKQLCSSVRGCNSGLNFITWFCQPDLRTHSYEYVEWMILYFHRAISTSMFINEFCRSIRYPNLQELRYSWWMPYNISRLDLRLLS